MKVEQNNRIGFISINTYPSAHETFTRRRRKGQSSKSGRASTETSSFSLTGSGTLVWISSPPLARGEHHVSLTQQPTSAESRSRCCRTSVGSTPVPAELSQFSGITLIPVQ